MNDAELRKRAGQVTARLGEGRRRILFITGAGLSAESGLPTYRGIGGLYENGESSCGAVVRPDVVLFGEMLPAHKVDELLRELARGFDAYFSVGTTSVFPYIAEPIHHAAQWVA